MPRLLRWLVRLWRVDDSWSQADVVAVVSFGLRADRTLASATEASDKLAKFVFGSSHASTLVYGGHRHTVDPVVEMRLRAEGFRPIPSGSMLCIGTTESTIEEAERMAAGLRDAGRFPRSVIFVTGPCHSRTARWVWGKVFPTARVFVRSISFDDEIDPQDPMLFNRNGWAWFLVNVARHIVFRLIGFRAARALKIHQPNAR